MFTKCIAYTFVVAGKWLGRIRLCLAWDIEMYYGDVNIVCVPVYASTLFMIVNCFNVSCRILLIVSMHWQWWRMDKVYKSYCWVSHRLFSGITMFRNRRCPYCNYKNLMKWNFFFWKWKWHLKSIWKKKNFFFST